MSGAELHSRRDPTATRRRIATRDDNAIIAAADSGRL